jgi:hypothetical protein
MDTIETIHFTETFTYHAPITSPKEDFKIYGDKIYTWNLDDRAMFMTLAIIDITNNTTEMIDIHQDMHFDTCSMMYVDNYYVILELQPLLAKRLTVVIDLNTLKYWNIIVKSRFISNIIVFDNIIYLKEYDGIYKMNIDGSNTEKILESISVLGKCFSITDHDFCILNNAVVVISHVTLKIATLNNEIIYKSDDHKIYQHVSANHIIISKNFKLSLSTIEGDVRNIILDFGTENNNKFFVRSVYEDCRKIIIWLEMKYDYGLTNNIWKQFTIVKK